MAKADMEGVVSKAIDRHMQGGVIMLELPAGDYLEANAASVVALTRKSFDGIYVSLQQPYKNAYSMLRRKGADASRLVFIDSAPGQDISGCVHISGRIDVGELIGAINSSLPNLKSSKRFIFIDSVAAITAHNPLSETMRLFEFLARAVKKNDTPELLLIFNITDGEGQGDFIRDSVIKVDEIVKVG